MMNKKHPFECLKDPSIENQFNLQLLEMIEKWEYVVFTVLIDKFEHQTRYSMWKYDPYHYCLAVITERYTMFLNQQNSRGDLMAESRGGKEDMRLKKSFNKLFDQGTDFMDAQYFQKVLTSSQLKVKNKANNIAGLQLADIIAHPSRKDILRERGLMVSNTKNFGDRIIEILAQKYYQNPTTGQIYGYGKKFLP